MCILYVLRILNMKLVLFLSIQCSGKWTRRRTCFNWPFLCKQEKKQQKDYYPSPVSWAPHNNTFYRRDVTWHLLWNQVKLLRCYISSPYRTVHKWALLCEQLTSTAEASCRSRGFIMRKERSLCCIKRNTSLYMVEALSKQRAHTIMGNAHTPTQTQTHMPSVFFFPILNGDEDKRK